MEDAHIVSLNLPKDCAIFGIFDGHGGNKLNLSMTKGPEVSKFVSNHFIDEL